MLVPKQQRPLKFLFLHFPKILREDAWVPPTIIGIIALIIHDELSSKNILLVIGLTIGFSLAYVVNDYFDAEADQHDELKSENNFFVHNSISKQIAVVTTLSIIMILFIIFVNFGYSGIILLAISLLMIFLYSSPKINLKSKPPFDILAHSIFIHTFPFFLVLYLIIGNFEVIDFFIMVVLFIASFIIQLENQVRDYNLDIVTSFNSTISWGLETSIRLIKITSFMLSIFTVILFLFFEELRFLIPYGLIYSPVIFQRLWFVQNTVRSPNFIRNLGILGIIYTIVLVIQTVYTRFIIL
ncbi:MAG: 1,4-dihydroxy-2-naphthoate octaprenyltransferase [Candidatus Heimdallarchaeota archaeon LC_2]|nr:MAG: 1,4-dihydroxy-2-naphthoate octaprenyltransferase [Candidatus Heimdallarchaeota archaeon LC_2]